MSESQQTSRLPFELLKESRRFELIPDAPGVYLYYDKSAKILYVGKAKYLRRRIRSYCQERHDYKTALLVSKIALVEYTLTDSEVEALILEAAIIKQRQPFYNILLKDDKKYPYVKIDLNSPYPAVIVTRNLQHRRRVRYFGPYTDVTALRRTIKAIRDYFPLRDCRNLRQRRLCLNYHIGRCLGPCEKKVERDEYRALIDEVILFLEGRSKALLRQLRQRMQRLALAQKYEGAAQVRDLIVSMEATYANQQKMEVLGGHNEDYIGVFVGGSTGCGVVLCQRAGKIINKYHYPLLHLDSQRLEDVTQAFMLQYYQGRIEYPDRVNIGLELADMELVATGITSCAAVSQNVDQDDSGVGGRRQIVLQQPQRGKRVQLVALAAKNAADQYRLYQSIWAEEEGGDDAALDDLAQMLDIPQRIRRIEAYDISNLGDQDAVGGMVVWEGGRFVGYRRYKIKTVSGQDDYGMLREVLSRRFSTREERLPWPDLLLIDGGLGQLSATYEMIKELGVEIPLISLAKQEELIYCAGSTLPLALPVSCRPLRIVTGVRDEVHRYSISFHRKVRDRRVQGSSLRAIKGVGPALESALLRHFGTPSAVFAATKASLCAVRGVTSTLAERILSQA